jgi:Domain of unknown function (DUF4276)
MTQLDIVVEGPTEETFVRDVLKPHFGDKQIFLKPLLVITSRDNRTSETTHGGLHNYARPKDDIQRLLGATRSGYVTTMFDFYALPKSFPGYQNALRLSDPYSKAQHLQQAFFDDLASQRFIPYIQLHEFEALLFTDVSAFCNTCNLGSYEHKHLKGVRDIFSTPEHINDNPQTAPSKRILSIYSSYEKIIDGVRITKAIGLTTLREHCLHFNAWLEKLEALASP